MLGEFDSPNGTKAWKVWPSFPTVAGVYYVDVTPLGQTEEVVPGNYDSHRRAPPGHRSGTAIR